MGHPQKTKADPSAPLRRPAADSTALGMTLHVIDALQEIAGLDVSDANNLSASGETL
jgi:hypothetical protein